MADSEERQNPFDYLHGYLDDDATFDKNAENLYGLLSAGKLDLHVVAELLVEAATMPILARENMQLCAALKEASGRLQCAEATLQDYETRYGKSEEDDPPEETERRPCRILKFPKGVVVN